MKIEIIGMGCPKCRQMTADVEAVIAQLGLDAEIGRIDDPQTIVQMGIFSIPRLAIDGKLVPFRYRGRPSIRQLFTQIEQEQLA